MKEGEPVKQYRALAGLSYPATKKDLDLCIKGQAHERREVEPGEIVSDIPSVSLPWLLEDGRIEEVTDGSLRS